MNEAHHLALRAALVALVTAVAGGAAWADAVTRPRRERPAPESRAPCEQWVGSSSGNAALSVRAVLCRDGDEVRGTVLFFEPGGSATLRAVEGAWRGGLLSLRQTRVVRERVGPAWRGRGWYWCATGSSYDLTAVGARRLEGTYVSPGCDRGAISLTAARRGG